WLLELKYLPAGSKPATIEAAFADAEQQVARYAGDQALLGLLVGDRALKAGMLVFVGAKKVLFRPWPPPPTPPPAQRPPQARAPAPRRARGQAAAQGEGREIAPLPSDA